MIDAEPSITVENVPKLQPYFLLDIPPILDVMAALVSSFVIGIGIAYTDSPTLKKGCAEFRTLLPLYIFGIFLGMTYVGEAYHILMVFGKIICIIFVLHIVILIYEFLIAGGMARKNPLRLLLNMIPAYLTALGTSSSAATIPVTLRQTKKNGVSDEIASFCVPLCATIHLSGSMMKITCCALTVCHLHGGSSRCAWWSGDGSLGADGWFAWF